MLQSSVEAEIYIDLSQRFYNLVLDRLCVEKEITKGRLPSYLIAFCMILCWDLYLLTFFKVLNPRKAKYFFCEIIGPYSGNSRQSNSKKGIAHPNFQKFVLSF